MREWNLKEGDPLALTLAADARFKDGDYYNDHIWELTLGRSEPPAVVLETTYGLRARSLRMFPRFTEGDVTRNDPSSFASPPTLCNFSPNYLLLSFSPFTGIQISAQYWIPESQAAGGRFLIKNLSGSPRQLRFEWFVILNPAGKGQGMAPANISGAPVLAGKTGGLAPVVLVTGGPRTGAAPFPSLILNLELKPGETNKITWTQAALSTEEASFELARKIAASNWEAELARIDLVNSGLVEVYTGDPDWDAAFAFSQKAAYGLFVGSTPHLPFPSFVQSRQPENGFSIRGDGLDYNHLWNGQTPLDAWYLSGILLPSSPHLVQGLLRNFLAAMGDDGFIDWKPGLGGQRSKLLATPLLAGLAKSIYQATGNLAFLNETFPSLLAFFSTWFLPNQDRDGDGIPEWSHPMQSGFDDQPLFAHWQAWAQGADITTAESPALCAFLYQEAMSLIDIALVLDKREAAASLKAMAGNLRSAVEISWDGTASIYRNWDRDSHFCSRSEIIASQQGPGRILIERSYEHPLRLLVKIETGAGVASHPSLSVHGVAPNGQHFVERISPERFHWYPGRGSATSQRVFSQLEFVVLEGVEGNDKVTLQRVGYDCDDQTLLLPLWAGIPAEERVQSLVEHTITSPDRFWGLFGIPACPTTGLCEHGDTRQNIHLPWNVLIGEGLLAYGYRQQAAELIEKMMEAIIRTLKQERCFRKHYHSESGCGLGDKNSVAGLAPLGFFLDILGVRLISPYKVALSGFNPFPWPITVKYRGMTVLRGLEKTTVVFPDGQMSMVSDSSPCIVSLE